MESWDPLEKTRNGEYYVSLKEMPMTFWMKASSWYAEEFFSHKMLESLAEPSPWILEYSRTVVCKLWECLLPLLSPTILSVLLKFPSQNWGLLLLSVLVDQIWGIQTRSQSCHFCMHPLFISLGKKNKLK